MCILHFCYFALCTFVFCWDFSQQTQKCILHFCYFGSEITNVHFALWFQKVSVSEIGWDWKTILFLVEKNLNQTQKCILHVQNAFLCFVEIFLNKNKFELNQFHNEQMCILHICSLAKCIFVICWDFSQQITNMHLAGRALPSAYLLFVERFLNQLTDCTLVRVIFSTNNQFALWFTACGKGITTEQNGETPIGSRFLNK